MALGTYNLHITRCNSSTALKFTISCFTAFIPKLFYLKNVSQSFLSCTNSFWLFNKSLWIPEQISSHSTLFSTNYYLYALIISFTYYS